MTLGLVANGKRTIRSGSEYEKYFTNNIVEGNEVELLADGDVYDTLKQMKRIVDKTLSQTKAIAKHLKGSSLKQTCNNIWAFLYNHVQYKKDNPLREQLRTPARTWKDRTSGVDCDCFSIFISSVLTNLGIPHAFRMAGYKSDFQHVYVVVPIEGKTLSVRNSYYVIDPVVDSFDYEVPFKKKHDHKMTKVTMLNGFGECTQKPEILRRRKFVDDQEIVLYGYIPTKLFLDDNKIPYAPAFDNDNDRSVYVVNTPIGLKQVPTVITKQQGEQLLNTMKLSPCSQSASNLFKKFPWWALVIGAGALVLFTAEGQEEVTTGLKGLSGITKRKAVKRKKKNYRTITI
jgi:hypothetical protein